MDVDIIHFKRPEKHNALDLDHLKEIYDELCNCSNPVVIYGEPSFSSGLDLNFVQHASEPEIIEFADIANDLILRIASHPKPVVAFVKGYTFGAGFSIALACDAIVADESAVFSTGFAKLGIAPDMGVSFLLPRITGLKRALRLLSTAERFGVDEAIRLGIVDRKGNLDDAVDLARRMDGNSIKYIKELVYSGFREHVMREKEMALKSIEDMRNV
ncbi:enoyl-CoA hydratase/isomerase family protein [Geoglobus acetivorans]|uniref:Enoyl-CoA hydratase n=1 Tax=Geoglobus acetivorans TaxID=565033 RepID=A0A0A7GB80_GEOAI|nr:Enoyl-CoA hydratase [Geoglobus acetivorans]